ncbi:MAG: ATP-dependent Clp protease ATP-binding subunit ClpA [Pseudobdellovibrionaceae bacterium]
MLSRELERYLSHAMEYAKEKKHEYTTLEHILFALTESPKAVEILESCGANIQDLRKILQEFLAKNCPPLTDEQVTTYGGYEAWHPEFTLACHRLLQRAAMQVQNAGKTQVSEGNILIALYHEKNSYAVFALSQQGVSQFDIINFISHGITKDKEHSHTAEAEMDIDGSPKDESKKSPLESFCINLNEKAKKGKVDPLIGREDVLDRAIQVLSRRTKNNPLFIGEPGVGKTALAEGLAARIVAGEVPQSLHNAVVYALDLGTLLAGTKFRGDFEGRLKGVVKELQKRKNSILFIDEIHTLVGAGATSGGSMDASNLIKPALADGRFSCMGSTTHTEYRQHFEKDRALSRRFQRIDVKEPSIAQTIEILKGLKKHYEDFHHVKFSEGALKAAAELSAKYIQGRQLPDKAIDVIDEAGARAKIAAQLQYRSEDSEPKVIRTRDVELVIASIAQVPPQSISASDRQQLKDLDKRLKSLIFGQNEAIDKLVSSIKFSRSGLGRGEKPIGSFLFAGPTGVGKTEVCKQLAVALGVQFVRFDMSEYMEKHAVARLVGAPPGYVGYEEGGLLTEQLNKSPYCVLLLDEIEKAHPDIMNILLQVMDAGRLTDSNGRTADFKNCILVMTTNAGAAEVAKGTIGITESTSSSQAMDAIKRMFAPEFINRLDSVVYFKDLSEDIVLQIVNKFISELAHQLGEKRIDLEVSSEAQKWLLQKGYDKVYGARPLARTIDEHIKKALVDELLFGRLVKGGTVKVTVGSKKTLEFEIHARSETPTPVTT